MISAKNETVETKKSHLSKSIKALPKEDRFRYIKLRISKSTNHD